MTKSKNKGKQQGGQPQPQGKGKAPQPSKGQVKAKVEAEEDFDDEENDFDLMNEDDDIDDEDEFGDDDDLFWTLTVEPNEDVMLKEPSNPDSIICITHACFGEKVNKDSRTILCCSTSTLEEPVPICILNSGAHESQPLNLKFGAPAAFSLKGHNPSTVYLSGHLQPDMPPMMDDMDAMGGMDDMDEEDLDEEEEEESRTRSRKRGAPEEDIHSQEPTTKKRKIEPQQKAAEAKKTPETNKQKNTPNKPQATPTNNESTPENKPLSKKQLKKQKQQQQGKTDDKPNADSENKENTTEKTESKEPATEQPRETPSKTENKEETTNNNDQTKSQKKLPNGIEFKDIKVGAGPTVQNGQTLRLYYVGQLEDKTVFDKSLTGDGFEFKLGSPNVIQGWNLGIKGMKVGGKRRIVIPPKFAYGEKGTDDKKIPANATLTFTIEIREAK